MMASPAAKGRNMATVIILLLLPCVIAMKPINPTRDPGQDFVLEKTHFSGGTPFAPNATWPNLPPEQQKLSLEHVKRFQSIFKKAHDNPGYNVQEALNDETIKGAKEIMSAMGSHQKFEYCEAACWIVGGSCAAACYWVFPPCVPACAFGAMLCVAGLCSGK